MSARRLDVLADRLVFPEGPRWHDNRLYLVDHLLGRVYVLGEHGLDRLVDVAEQPSGMGWSPGGDHLIVSMNDRRLLRFDGGTLDEVAPLEHLAPGPLNDMVVGPTGIAYIGNFGSDVSNGEPLTPTVLLRVDPGGRARVVAENLVFPNGTVITPDGRTMIIAESFAQRLTAFDIDEYGNLSGRRVWAQFGDTSGVPRDMATIAQRAHERREPIPDGIALDADGAVWISDPVGTAVLRVAEGGEVLERVSTGDLGSYAVALGGPERRILYICANIWLGALNPGVDREGRLLACRVDVPGAGYP